MARMVRRVSMGTDFANGVKRAWRGHVCPNCKAEMVEEIDHIQPLVHGGNSNEENSLGLCRSCHGKKTYAENYIYNARDARAHIKAWGALRETRLTGADIGPDNLKLLRKIERAKRQNNLELARRLRKEKELILDPHYR